VIAFAGIGSPDSFFDLLKNNKIKHWWYSSDVQDVRKEFLNNFAKSNENWLDELTDVLLEELNE